MKGINVALFFMSVTTTTTLDKFAELMLRVLHCLGRFDIPITRRLTSLIELITALLSDSNGNYRVELSDLEPRHCGAELKTIVITYE